MLELCDVSLCYGPIKAVSDLSLQVREGQIVSLLGRNGAGKTTTLSGVLGINRATGGEIRLQGKRIDQLATDEIARLGVAYVPEGRGTLAGLTVRENLLAGAYGHGLSRDESKAGLDRAVDIFPALSELMSRRAGVLSGGEQQMLALARALIGRPRLLLLDEPSLGLAPIMVRRVYESLAELNRTQGITALVVEQYVDFALDYSEHCYLLEKGRLARHMDCGPGHPALDFTSEYFG